MLVAGQSMAAKGERPVSSKVAKPGGFFPRMIALIIDSAILGVVSLPIYGLWVSQLQPLKIDAGTNIVAEIAQRQVSLRVALLALQMFYFAGSWSMLGGTPGQLLLNLRVTDARAGGIGFFRALLRWFCFAIFGIFSIVLVPISKQKRALHDILAGTWVIQIVDSPELLAAGGAAAAGGLPPPAARAAAPVPAPVPAIAVPAPLVAAAVAAPAYSAPSPAAATAYAPPPSARPAAPEYAPPPAAPAPIPVVAPAAYAPPPMDFPPMPMASPEPAASHPAPQATSDAGLYAPPPMMDEAPSAPREVYSPTPGEISDRAVKAAELYTASPLADPPPPAAPVEPAPSDAHAAETPHPHAPAPSNAELPPIEFPPMAPPKGT